MRDVLVRMKLKVRVVHYRCGGVDCWYADIDDADDRQPDDPYWCVDGCRTHADALSAACAQLAIFDQLVAADNYPARLSDSALSA